MSVLAPVNSAQKLVGFYKRFLYTCRAETRGTLFFCLLLKWLLLLCKKFIEWKYEINKLFNLWFSFPDMKVTRKKLSERVAGNSWIRVLNKASVIKLHNDIWKTFLKALIELPLQIDGNNKVYLRNFVSVSSCNDTQCIYIIFF